MNRLNDTNKDIRLAELKRLVQSTAKAASGDYVNNHIHTFYSFSPYSPAKAVWKAYLSGLKTAGIMDHDSVSGTREFIEAGEITGVETTNGVECRASFANTALAGRRINNPDQDTVAYVALHAIPHQNIDSVSKYFEPLRKERNKRNRAMTAKINDITGDGALALDFEKDIIPLSKASEGGSITERHLLYALALKITGKYGRGEKVTKLLSGLDIELSSKAKEFLENKSNPFYEYDLLGVLKSGMVEKFYIDATEECPDVAKLISFSKSIGAIAAYAYLGDVGESVTGDKKTQRFEDSYIEQLFEQLYQIGFDAVTYMPSRNTAAQLEKIRRLCDKYAFMQISGEDINSPRQSFVCPMLLQPEFNNLVKSTWELIRHEREFIEG